MYVDNTQMKGTEVINYDYTYISEVYDYHKGFFLFFERKSVWKFMYINEN